MTFLLTSVSMQSNEKMALKSSGNGIKSITHQNERNGVKSNVVCCLFCSTENAAVFGVSKAFTLTIKGRVGSGCLSTGH